MGVHGAAVVVLLCGQSIVRMVGVVVPCGGRAAAMMVNHRAFTPGVALRQTQHGSRHGPPDREQDDHQQQ